MFPDLTEKQIQLSGRHEPGSGEPANAARATALAPKAACHLKRRYGLRRSRLKGHDLMRAWTGLAILAYGLDTLAIRIR